MPKPNPNAPSKEQLYQDYFIDKIPVNELAKKYSYAHNSAIYDLLKRYEFKSRGYNTPTKEQIYEDYVINDLLLEDIAKKNGCSPSSVMKLIIKYNIPRRGHRTPTIQKIPFTERQLQIVRGTLLGDASLENHKSTKSPRLSVEHGIKQKDYTEWLFNELSPFPTKLTTRIIQPREIKGVMVKEPKEAIRFRTSCHPDLTPIHKEYYPDGKKNFSRELLDKIDDLGLAVWYMDDGVSCHRKSLEICTGIMPIETQQNISNWFLERWGIESRIRYTENGGYRIKFIREHAVKLATIINPHIHPSMAYKIKGLV